MLRVARDIAPLLGFFAGLASRAFVIALSGCAVGAATGERAPTIEARDVLERITPPSAAQSYPFEVRVAPFSDNRPSAPTRKIGDVRATVFDLHANELIVDQEVGAILTAALDAQLAASGFRPHGDAAPTIPVAHDVFELSGRIDELSLNVAGRDEVSIAIEARVRDPRDGRVIWSGVIAEKRDRYAGVSGNTRRSIARFLGEALGTVARDTVARAGNSILQARPELLQTSTQNSLAALASAVTLSSVATSAIETSQNIVRDTSGRLRITTAPARAQVYIGDVYFGLSPLDVQLDPAIHLLRLELDGFKPTTQKVSVRNGETTELEVTLEK